MTKWIGNEVNTSGSYYEAGCEELKKRNGGTNNGGTLYEFSSRFDENYYISDIDVIEKIETLIDKKEPSELIDYLYKLTIDKFGAVDLLVRIGHKIARQRDEGYKAGKEAARSTMREALGL